MADQIDMSNGQANFATTLGKAWHGLGHDLPRGASNQEWKEKAGFLWKVLPSSLYYTVEEGGVERKVLIKDRLALRRSDTNAYLATVSRKYQVYQPEQVMEFFRRLTETAGFELRTAGMLYGGAKYWGLAEVMKPECIFKGEDEIAPYVLLATACDGSMSTCAQYTSVAVVCDNTLRAALAEGREAKRVVSIPHSTTVKENVLLDRLGIADGAFGHFMEDARKLAKATLADSDAKKLIVEILGDPDKDIDMQIESKISNSNVANAWKLYTGAGRGSELSSRKGTMWGLLNATTEYFDHHNGKNQDARLSSAWLGKAGNVKDAAFDKLLVLAGA
jgi:phage/plasmid-like protein (TIGR03299 family)